jgi:phosphatidylglycerol---prolipoprotein diacylglyceryl transferase
MQQVLLRIPLKADWLPFGLPLWVALLAVFLVVAAAVYGGARFAPRWKLDPKTVQGAAFWVAVAGLIVGGLAFFFADSGLPIYGFGMMLFLAFVVCNWLGGRRAVSEGVPKEAVQDLAIWLIVGGLIGARLTSILTSHNPNPPNNLWDFLYQFIRIWDGGIVLYGAVIGGALSYVVAYFLVFRKQGLSTLKLADIIAPSLAVGLCLGRIGCFLNGCCYGQVACTDCPVYPVSFPLSAPPRYTLVKQGYQTAAGFTLAEEKSIDLDPAQVGRVQPGSAADRAGLKVGDEILEVDGAPLSGPGARYAKLSAAENLDQYLGDFGEWPRGKNDLTLTVQTGVEAPRTLTLQPWTLGLHPTQLYESVSMILLFLLLTAYYPFRRHDGQVMALMMICYAAHRYLNELLRADERPEGFESWTSVILLVAGVALWLWLQRQPAQYRFQSKEFVAASQGKATPAPQVLREAGL